MKKIIKNTLEIVFSLIMAIFFMAILWLMLLATPDQCSAEADLIYDEMAKKGL